MPSLLHEEIGISASGDHWEVGGFKLWQSTQADVVLYSLQQPAIALDSQSNQLQTGLTVVREWRAGIDQVVNGTLSFVVSLVPQLSLTALEQLKQQWREQLSDRGVEDAQLVKFLPLPRRSIHAQIDLDASVGKVTAPAESSVGDTCMFLVKLTKQGAENWVKALEKKQVIPSSALQFTYEYPQQLPSAKAEIQVDAKRMYAKFAASLHREEDGKYVGNREEVLSVWEAMIRDRQIQINFSDPLPSNLDEQYQNLINTLIENTSETLLNLLFTSESGSSSERLHRLKWQKQSDAANFKIQVEIEGGWTWLQGNLSVQLADLFAEVDSRYLNTTYLERSFPVSITVQGDPLLQTVALSWSADNGQLPEAIVFSSEGGKRDYLLSSRNPDVVRISYQAKISYTPAKWSTIEVKNSETVANGGNQIVLRPIDWVRKLMIHLLVREGDRIRPATDLPTSDSLIVNLSYQGAHLAAPIKISARITPTAPVQFTYLIDPQKRPDQLRFSVMGTLNGQLARVAEQSIRAEETDVYILLDRSRIQLVSRDSILPEDDALAQRLINGGLRPVITS
jgi:hypothetical protein